MERVVDVLWLENVEREKFLGWGSGKLPILLRGKCWHTMSRLTGDGDTHTALSDNLSYLFQQYSRAVEVNLEDCLDRGLAWRNTSGIDEHLDVAMLLCLGDEVEDWLSWRQVHLHREGIEASLVHRLGYRLGILTTFVTDYDFHTITHTACYRHTNLTCTSQNHYVLFHISAYFLFCYLNFCLLLELLFVTWIIVCYLISAAKLLTFSVIWVR